MPKSRIHLEASEAELTVKCPFNSVWRDCARAAGGQWVKQRKLWVFAPEAESHVRELLTSVFGDDGSAEEDDAGVTIRVTALADHRAELGAIHLAGREIARAFGPASRVRIGTGVRFLVGAASPEGAAGAWSTMVPAGSVLEIRNVPLAQAALLTGAHEGWQIEALAPADRLRAALLAEQEALHSAVWPISRRGWNSSTPVRKPVSRWIRSRPRRPTGPNAKIAVNYR